VYSRHNDGHALRFCDWKFSSLKSLTYHSNYTTPWEFNIAPENKPSQKERSPHDTMVLFVALVFVASFGSKAFYGSFGGL